MRSAECVTPSHPDKLCDRISDAILDACLEQDAKSRVAIETMGGHGIITITGELTTKAYVNIPDVVRKIVGPSYGIQTNIVQQSPEISGGVDTGGAGDQGIMVGYACNDNEAMIPDELYYARGLAKHLYTIFPFDGKTQVTMNDMNEIVAIVASFQNVPAKELERTVYQWIEKNHVPCDIECDIFCNPAGDWVQGGFEADTGLTGRKLAVDNYGPQIPLGGGCFSGKDATKVDRSAAYMARHLAVEILKESQNLEDPMAVADNVTVKLAYAIGKKYPVMATAEIGYPMGHTVKRDLLKEGNAEICTPQGMIDFLNLRAPQFEKTAEWGHFGNGFEWDK